MKRYIVWTAPDGRGSALVCDTLLNYRVVASLTHARRALRTEGFEAMLNRFYDAWLVG